MYVGASRSSWLPACSRCVFYSLSMSGFDCFAAARLSVEAIASSEPDQMRYTRALAVRKHLRTRKILVCYSHQTSLHNIDILAAR